MADDMAEDRPPEGGAVLVARAIQDSDVWAMPEHYLKLWLYLLLNVRWDDRPHRIGSVSVGYGQILKSYRKIAEENEHTHNRQVQRWSTSQVKAVLDWLESEGMIETLGTELGTLITVRKFKEYQAFSTYGGRNPERDSEQLGTTLNTQLGTTLNTQKASNSNAPGGEASELGTPPKGEPVNNRNEEKEREELPIGDLWQVWIEELGGEPPHPKLSTGRRRQRMELLYREQLAQRDDPISVFRQICRAVKRSDHHMSERAFHLPESLFTNAERRERWTIDALKPQPIRKNGIPKPNHHGGPYVPGAYGNA